MKTRIRLFRKMDSSAKRLFLIQASRNHLCGSHSTFILAQRSTIAVKTESKKIKKFLLPFFMKIFFCSTPSFFHTLSFNVTHSQVLSFHFSLSYSLTLSLLIKIFSLRLQNFFDFFKPTVLTAWIDVLSFR